jgi:DNA polymerase-3 subunit epsilon
MDFRWIGKSKDGHTVTLKKIENCAFQLPLYANQNWMRNNLNLIRNGSVIDVETTGLNRKEDKIIEIGLRQFKFNRLSGEILSVGEFYSSFQDPNVPLTEEIKKLTGIDDEMVKGQSIDWLRVEKMLSESDIIVAHNAGFDRPFIDRHVPISQGKIWSCSLKQIDWAQKGFSTHKLEILSIYHGFFTDSHRALNDVDALLYLLNFRDEQGSPYFQELIKNARRSPIRLTASKAPFDSKDTLKKHGYQWENENRCWYKMTYKEEIDSEISWLEEAVYEGQFLGSTQEILTSDNFKIV